MRSCDRLHRLAVIGVVALQPALMRAQDSSLLSNVAWTYAQLIDYRVEVETKVRNTKRRFVLAASRPQLWYVHELVRGPARGEVLLGSDGESMWGVAPLSKRYVLHHRSFEPTEEWRALRDIHSRYLLRYQMIDLMGATAAFVGYKTRSDGARKVRCAVLRLVSGNDWAEEIWVDPQRSIVLRSLLRKRGVALEETEWRNLQLDGTVEPSLFRFVPPRGAMRTTAISIP